VRRVAPLYAFGPQKVSILFVLFLGFLPFPVALHAQFIVDCSGANPNAFPSITAALQQAPLVGSTILVTGTCSETVNVFGMIALNLGAPYGQSATINGALSISSSQNVFLYGLRVTNSPVDGITVSDSCRASRGLHSEWQYSQWFTRTKYVRCANHRLRWRLR